MKSQVTITVSVMKPTENLLAQAGRQLGFKNKRQILRNKLKATRITTSS